MLNKGMLENNIPKVLLDTCIFSNADQARWIQEKIELLPNSPISNNMLLKCVEKDLSKVGDLLNKEIPFIQKVGDLARLEKVMLYSYSELDYEFIVHKKSSSPATTLYAFRGVKFYDIEPPIQRHLFFQGADFIKNKSIDIFIPEPFDSKENNLDDSKQTKENYINMFMNWLLKLTESEISKFMKIPRFNSSCSDKVHEFQKICSEKVFGRKKAIDAYHYWAAECAGLDYFLTVDKKFKNNYEIAKKDRHIQMKCAVLYPSELFEKISKSIE